LLDCRLEDRIAQGRRPLGPIKHGPDFSVKDLFGIKRMEKNHRPVKKTRLRSMTIIEAFNFLINQG
jgi:hypothetical protein